MERERKSLVDLDALCKTLVDLHDSDLQYVWGHLVQSIHLCCGTKRGRPFEPCWYCYESREYPDD